MDPLDVILVIAKMTFLGQQVLNVFQTTSTGAHSVDDAIEDVLDGIDGVYNAIDGDICDDVAAVSVVLKNLTQDFDMGEHDWPNFAGGLLTGDPLPTQVAGLVTMPTARLKTRGRKFIPGISEADTLNGLYDASVLGAMVNFGVALTQTFIGVNSGDPYAWGVIGSDAAFWPFISSTASNIPSTNRKRKIGVGA